MLVIYIFPKHGGKTCLEIHLYHMYVSVRQKRGNPLAFQALSNKQVLRKNQYQLYVYLNWLFFLAPVRRGKKLFLVQKLGKLNFGDLVIYSLICLNGRRAQQKSEFSLFFKVLQFNKYVLQQKIRQYHQKGNFLQNQKMLSYVGCC